MTKQFKKPAFVYVYIDKETDLPVYIGKVNAGNSLDSRINDHRTDYWYEENNQEIYYTPVESSSTADMLETALINYYNDKDVPLKNIAKMTWGPSSHLSKESFGWIPYEQSNPRLLKINKDKLETLDSLIARKEKELSDVFHQIESLQKKMDSEIESLQSLLHDYENLKNKL